MAKGTKSGPSFSDTELEDPDPPDTMLNNLPTVDRPQVTRFQVGTLTELGGEQSSVGNNSGQSSRDGFSSNRTQRQPRRALAQTTENLSDPSPEGQDSTVNSMGGSGQGTEPESTEVPPYEEWKYRDLQTECGQRELSGKGSFDDLVERLEQYDYDHAETE